MIREKIKSIKVLELTDRKVEPVRGLIRGFTGKVRATGKLPKRINCVNGQGRLKVKEKREGTDGGYARQNQGGKGINRRQ